MFNAAVGLWATWFMRPLIQGDVAGLRARAVIAISLLFVGFIKADSLTLMFEEENFNESIVYSKSSPYQRIIVTRGKTGYQLFLNGHLQFNSMDEYRYHEALVHPAMSLGKTVRRVLVLGGGDGLAVREVLRHPSVESVTLVDLDPEMTRLAKEFAPLAELNLDALSDPRVEVINQDAMIWLEKEVEPFDVAIIDFPDPNTFALGKLYTTRFYKLLKARLLPDAAVAIQCTSPFYARKSFWCIVRTMEAAGFFVRPYHVALPSFDVWGFALARLSAFDAPAKAPEGLRFLNDESMAALFALPSDLGPVPAEVNRLDNQRLVRYYVSEWRPFEQ
jgi:spermidine synthase